MATAAPPQGTRELAEHYGVSLETARRWLRLGTVPGRKLPSGSRWRIAPEALQDLSAADTQIESGHQVAQLVI